jgi:hypothetical protein
MCTVSWLPQPEGYTLCCNRDERLTRGPARPPAVHLADGVRFLAPLDGDHGGTWIAVNEFGLCLTLLNRYQGSTSPPDHPRSRGLVLLELAPAPTLAEAAARLTRSDLARVAGFTLVAVEPGRPAAITSWDGRRLTTEGHEPAGLIATSSAVLPEQALSSRRELFSLEPLTPERLVAIHRSHEPERGPRSVCMHRDDAETRSFTRVTVADSVIELSHVPAAPCQGTALSRLALPRRQPSASVTE